MHEKSILLPLLPAGLLALEEPLLFRWLTYHAMLSMLPLLYRDHLILPYVALLTLFAFTHYSPYRRCNKGGIDSSVLQKVLMTSSLLCSLVLHLIYLTLQPPKKYPFLFEALIMIICFSQFVIITIYANRKQWMLLDSSVELEKAKKTLWSVIWQTATVSLWKLIYFVEVIVFYTLTISVLLTLYGVFPNFTTQLLCVQEHSLSMIFST